MVWLELLTRPDLNKENVEIIIYDKKNRKEIENKNLNEIGRAHV